MTAQFSPPPRRVPLSLAIVNLCSRSAQIGWFVFGFGMIFVWTFCGNADFSFLLFRGTPQQAIGRIERSWQTSMSENRQHVYANAYSFSVGDQVFHGVSYSDGSASNPGDSARIEFLASKPQLSRIAGMRRGAFSPFVLFVVIFPAVGLPFIAFAWRRGSTENDLLRHGIFTTGTLKAQTPTNVTVNGRPMFKMTFEFTARDGRKHEASTVSNHPERLTDEPQEPMLYDPDDPSRAYILDEAPARPKLDGTGELIGRPFAAIFALIGPAIVLAANGLAIYLAFR